MTPLVEGPLQGRTITEADGACIVARDGWRVHRDPRADGAPAAIVARDAPGHASLARSPVMVSVCVCVCDAPVMSHSLGVP